MASADTEHATCISFMANCGADQAVKHVIKPTLNVTVRWQTDIKYNAFQNKKTTAGRFYFFFPRVPVFLSKAAIIIGMSALRRWAIKFAALKERQFDSAQNWLKIAATVLRVFFSGRFQNLPRPQTQPRRNQRNKAQPHGPSWWASQSFVGPNPCEAAKRSQEHQKNSHISEKGPQSALDDGVKLLQRFHHLDGFNTW